MYPIKVTQGFTMEKFIVDLGNRRCSCYFWKWVGIPYRHAIDAINYKLEQPQDYVHRYYKREAYKVCYGPRITPINGQELWPRTNSTPILPPSFKPPPGRPKKLRKREADENMSHSKAGRKPMRMKCNKCNQYGHNSRGCKAGKT